MISEQKNPLRKKTKKNRGVLPRFRSLKEGAPAIRLSKSSYLNARYRSYSSAEQLCIVYSARITVFLHENITCRLGFITISAILGLKYQTYFILSIFDDFFPRGHVPGAGKPSYF